MKIDSRYDVVGDYATAIIFLHSTTNWVPKNQADGQLNVNIDIELYLPS